MTVRGISKAVCSHYHLFQPFCPKLSLTTRVANAFFLALVIVIADVIRRAIYRSYTSKGPQPNPALITPTGRTQSEMAPLRTLRIHSIEEVDNIPKIVGVSIDLIEERAMPTVYNGETARGFIPLGDSLLKDIRTNWAQAERVGISHAEIARHLHYLIEAARANPQTIICYDPRTGSTNPAEEKIPRFQVLIRKGPDTDIFRPANAGPDVGASYEEAAIMNTALACGYIRWTPVRARYISEFGFYSTGMEFETVYTVLMAKTK